MATNCFTRSWLFLVLLVNTPVIAHYSQPSDYYSSPPSALLSKLEQSHLQQAHHQLEQHAYEYAWNELAFILHYFPNHPHALQQLGKLSLIIKQPQRATLYFERAIQLYPESYQTHSLYGQFLMQNTQYKLASAQFKKANSLDKKKR